MPRNRFTDHSSLGRLAMRLLNMLSWSCWKPNVYRYYCMADCVLSKAQIRSLDYAVSSCCRKIFTALHGMQTRSSDENSVCLSVRPSVRHTHELWQNGRNRDPTLLESPGFFWVHFPGPGKSWKMGLVLESPGNLSARSWKVLEFSRLW